MRYVTWMDIFRQKYPYSFNTMFVMYKDVQ